MIIIASKSSKVIKVKTIPTFSMEVIRSPD